MILVIPNMDLGIGKMGFIFRASDKDSDEQSRAQEPSCFWKKVTR